MNSSPPDTTDRPDHADRVPRVPGFELLRAIGEGGFGQVWLATNQTTGRLRAVKVIPLQRRGTSDPAGREVSSLTRLEENVRTVHPNLLSIDHVGETDEHVFYVMPPADDISGAEASDDASYRPATLQTRLADGPLPPDQCLGFARQLLAGLAALHEADMVHRDVKPANCLFLSGELKLADFGLLAEARPQMSQVGTQKYMPPDGQMGTRADVYAAGLVIYEMVTGLPVEHFPRLGERAPAVAEDATLRRLNRLLLRACEPDPQQRFSDAVEMLARLDAPEAGSRGRRWQSPRIALGVAACLIVAGTVAVFSWRPWTTAGNGDARTPGAEQHSATSRQVPRVHVNFITQPYFEATVVLDGKPWKDADGKPYRTPCTIPDLPAIAHDVVFQHDTHGELPVGKVDFSRQREIVAIWPSP